MAGNITYTINGTDISTLGIRVSASTGVIGIPKFKAPQVTAWPDAHGEVADLRAKRCEPRDITLKCWCVASSPAVLIQRLNSLRNLLDVNTAQTDSVQTARLQIDVPGVSPLLFEVYLTDGITPTKKWHNGKLAATFDLKLREQEPVKRILRFNGAATATLSFKTIQTVSVYWGDGTADYDCVGTTPISHTYQTLGTHYIIVAGDIDALQGFNTNASTIWSKI